MMRRCLALTAIALLSLTACEKKEESPAPTPSEAPVAPPPPTAAMGTAATVAEPTVDVASLPVEEQYEEEAEKDITPDNLSAKLDELEKEIAAP